ARRLLRHEVNLLVGRPLLDYVHPADRAAVAAVLEDLCRSDLLGATSAWRVRRDEGSWCEVECRASNLLADPNVGGLVLTLRDVSDRKQLDHLITALEDERRQLAGDLHDDAIQAISAGLMQLDVAERRYHGDDSGRVALGQARTNLG